MKEYLAVKENAHKVTHIKVETYYSLGGYSFATYTNKPRGYYLSVSPVEREDYGNGCVMEGCVAFSGYYEVLKEVTRKSKKAEAEADGLAQLKKKKLIDAVLAKNGLELA